MSRLTVGFVGVGTMGAPMALRVVGADFPTVVYGGNKANTDPLVSRGASVEYSLEELTTGCDVIMIVVATDPQVREVMGAVGQQAILAKARPGTVILIHSTVHPGLCQSLAADAATASVAVLDAPMTGSPDAAAAGKLSIMVGGDAEALNRVRPVLDAVATRVTYLGPSGLGQCAKIANNLVIASTMCAVREALDLATSAGIARETMLSLLASGGADSWVARSWNSLGATAETYPGGAAGLGDLTHKDVSLAIDLAQRNGISVPSAAIASQFIHEAYRRAYEHWRSDKAAHRPDSDAPS